MNDRTEVVVTGLRIPFWHLVGLMIQIAIASIPAAIVLAMLGSFIAALLATFGAAIGGGAM